MNGQVHSAGGEGTPGDAIGDRPYVPSYRPSSHPASGFTLTADLSNFGIDTVRTVRPSSSRTSNLRLRKMRRLDYGMLISRSTIAFESSSAA